LRSLVAHGESVETALLPDHSREEFDRQSVLSR
jgi:hypothetical protein